MSPLFPFPFCDSMQISLENIKYVYFTNRYHYNNHYKQCKTTHYVQFRYNVYRNRKKQTNVVRNETNSYMTLSFISLPHFKPTSSKLTRNINAKTST